MNNSISFAAPIAATGAVDNSRSTMDGVLEALARLGGKFSREDDIVFEGRQYRLPENQTLAKSVEFLNQRLADEEEEYRYSREFKNLPWDGAVAVGIAMREMFGALVGKAIKTPFGNIPPEFIDVQVGVNETVQAPWGRVTLPWDPDGFLNVGATHSSTGGGMVFQLQALTRRKYRDQVEGLFNYIQAILEERSIYRGRAITASGKPEFIDVSKVDPNDVIYAEDVMTELNTHVWLNIRHPQALRDNNQAMKRLVVVHGTYGTGKTLSAYLTGRECEIASRKIVDEVKALPEHEQRAALRQRSRDMTTFVIVRPGIDSFEQALNIAKAYGKCAIFVEDVDTMVDLTNDVAIRNMLDQTDGLTSKGAELQIIWTTNHLHKLPKGLLRPGRTDALIEIGNMDRPGVEKLCKRVINNLDPSVDYDAVFGAMEGYTPAYVREALDRTVRYSLAANEGTLGVITTADLVHAANGLRPQLQVMEEAPVGIERPALEGIFRDMVGEAVREFTASAVDDVVESRLDGASLYNPDGQLKLTLRTD